MTSKQVSASALLPIVLLLLSTSTEANVGKNHHAKNKQQLNNERPSLIHTFKNNCLSPIPFCNFLNSFGIVQSLDISRPTLVIKKQITAELHIPLPVEPPCENKQSNLISIHEKVTRPKKWEWEETDYNEKPIPKKWKKIGHKGKQRPKKWETLPGNDKNDFPRENDSESIDSKEGSRPADRQESEETFKKIRRPQKEDFEPDNKGDSKEEFQVKEVSKPMKLKETGDLKPESQVKDEESLEEVTTINKNGSLPNIRRPNITIFKEKIQTEHINRPIKNEFKTSLIDLDSLEDTALNDQSINEKKTASPKEEGTNGKEENNADGVDGSSDIDCNNNKNDVENYDDYIVEEHEKCGCKGKDVLDYDVSDETEVETEPKDTGIDITQVKPSECNEILRKLLLVLAPSLSSKQLTKAAELLSPSGDPSFLSTLQAMAKDSLPRDA